MNPAAKDSFDADPVECLRWLALPILESAVQIAIKEKRGIDYYLRAFEHQLRHHDDDAMDNLRRIMTNTVLLMIQQGCLTLEDIAQIVELHANDNVHLEPTTALTFLAGIHNDPSQRAKQTLLCLRWAAWSLTVDGTQAPDPLAWAAAWVRAPETNPMQLRASLEVLLRFGACVVEGTVSSEDLDEKAATLGLQAVCIPD